MAAPNADQNLLFGILALEMDFVSRDALVRAMHAWVLEKAKPLGQILVEQKALSADLNLLLDALVREHLKQHANDPQQSLAALRSIRFVREELGQVADPDLQASLAQVLPAGAEADDSYSTRAPSVGASTSSGTRFQILRPHARGGLGEVFVAQDVELHREVALKEIQNRHADHPESRSRFILEAEITGGLEHPGIVPVYGLGQYADGRPFYAMRFIRGDSLKDAIDRFHQEGGAGRDQGERALELRKLLGRFIDVCNAMAYAHSRGVLHRDLKPGNIMLGKYGETLVVDWGLAKPLGQKGPAENPEEPALRPASISGTAETLPGSALGTPQYMSPEQAAGRLELLGPASDVYSLGATLYCLLTGQAPFNDPVLGVVLHKVQRGEFPPPRQVSPTVPPALEAVCLRAMALKPGDRYGSPRALADDLEHWLADEPVTAFPEPWSLRMGRWARRHKTLVTTTAALLVTAVVALAISTLLIGEEQKKTAEEQKKTAAALSKEEQARKDRALAQVTALLDANPQAVPSIITGLEPFREDVLPRLRTLWNQEEGPDNRAQLIRVGLALLPVDSAAVKDRLYGWMLQADDPQELLLLRDALRPHEAELKEALWQKVDQPQTTSGERFRALVVLAAFDGSSERWQRAGDPVVGQLLSANPLHLGLWTEALRPVRLSLLAPLARVFRDRQTDNRRLAANILADYFSDSADVLTDLLMDADPRQYAVLLPWLQAHQDKVVPLLNQELARTLQPDWKDPPLDPAWSVPDPVLVGQIENAHGMVADRFALCQTMPLDQFSAVAEGLRPAGYRPTCFRPYTAGQGVQVAAVWARDGRDWKMTQAASPEEIMKQDASWRKKGYWPHDVAGYLANGQAEQYAALWVVQDPAVVDARFCVGIPGAPITATWQPLQQAGFILRTQTKFEFDGQVRTSAVWWKSDRAFDVHDYKSGDETLYESNLTPSNWQVDVRLGRAGKPPSTREQYAGQLAKAQKDLQASSDDLDARYRRAQAHFMLHEDEQALTDLSVFIEKGPPVATAYSYRALVHARLGKVEAARKDLAEFQKRSTTESSKAYCGAVTSAYLGEDLDGMRRLEDAIASHAKDADFLYTAACAYAAAAQIAQAKAVGVTASIFSTTPMSGWAVLPLPQAPGQWAKVGVYADRAVDLLQQAVANGYTDFQQLQKEPDLEGLGARPGFVALVKKGHLDRLYSAVWLNSAEFVSEELHGLDPVLHLQRCRELAAQGYRAATISVAWMGDGEPPVTASVWHRPVVPETAKDALARRQAQAAVALFQFGQPASAWPLLRHSPDPRLRTYLIHGLGPFGTDPQVLLRRLDEEQDVSARRALILSLGEFSEEHLPKQQRQGLIAKLLLAYRGDPDPGIHAAVAWLLVRWGQGKELRKIEQELVSKQALEARRWYVNGQGETLVVVPGPVEFWMGSPGSEPDRHTEETLHRVRIARSFALGSKDVTVEQFQRFLPDKPGIRHDYTKRYSPERDGPITSVTWFEAAQYCRWLSEQEGLPEDQMCYPPVDQIRDGMTMPPDYLHRTGYRLPTEAEWEYACRAGAVTSWFYGASEEMLPNYAWFLSNSHDRTWPGGMLKPNDLGLFDMHGNVSNWCQDRTLSYPFRPRGQPTEDTEDSRVEIAGLEFREIRNGSFGNHGSSMRCAWRTQAGPGIRGGNLGLRVARTYR